MRSVFLSLSLILALAACANVNYETTRAGTFEGELVVVWLAGTRGSGDGTFVYVPSPATPLTFNRPDGATHAKTIAPQMMYTDGGSVPSIGRVFNGLTPWNYAPAYMVHDWLFAARQCLNDGETGAPYDQLADVSFQESAEIIAEAIKALHDSGRVRKDDVSGATVTAAVTSPISRHLWTIEGACRPVSDAHRGLALTAIGQTPDIDDRAGLRTFTNEEGAVIREPAARVVAIISF